MTPLEHSFNQSIDRLLALAFVNYGERAPQYINEYLNTALETNAPIETILTIQIALEEKLNRYDL